MRHSAAMSATCLRMLAVCLAAALLTGGAMSTASAQSQVTGPPPTNCWQRGDDGKWHRRRDCDAVMRFERLLETEEADLRAAGFVKEADELRSIVQRQRNPTFLADDEIVAFMKRINASSALSRKLSEEQRSLQAAGRNKEADEIGRLREKLTSIGVEQLELMAKIIEPDPDDQAVVDAIRNRDPVTRTTVDTLTRAGEKTHDSK